MTELVFSGFGGQGVLTAGLIVADIALAHDMYATWIPSYGAEMRGGKANCTVKVDREQVGTPSLEEADILLAMNIPSLEFSAQVAKGGVVLVDSNFVEDKPEYHTRTDVRYYFIPFGDLARGAENARGSNVVAAGVVCALMKEFDRAASEQAMVSFFEEKGKGKFKAANIRAFNAGYEYMKQRLQN